MIHFVAVLLLNVLFFRVITARTMYLEIFTSTICQFFNDIYFLFYSSTEASAFIS